MLIKQKIPSLPRNLAQGKFGKLLIVFSKVNLLYLLYLRDLKCSLVLLIKQNCLKFFFSINSNVDESGISLPAFPSRTLKLRNVQSWLRRS